MDLRLPRPVKPDITRVVTGPINTAPDLLWPGSDVVARAEVLFPIVGERRSAYCGVELVDVKRFGIQRVIDPWAWAKPEYREHVERGMRHEIAKAVADLYVIHMEAEPFVGRFGLGVTA